MMYRTIKVRDNRVKLSVGDKVSFKGVNGEVLTDVITFIEGSVIEGKVYDLSGLKLIIKN